MIYGKVWQQVRREDVEVSLVCGQRTKDEQIEWLLGKLNAAGRRVVRLQNAEARRVQRAGK